MKKLLTIILIAVMVAMILSSCNSDDGNGGIGEHEPPAWIAVDIEPYVMQGKIDAVEITIGMTCDEVVEHYGGVYDQTDFTEDDYDDDEYGDNSYFEEGYWRDEDMLMRSTHDPRFVELRTMHTAYYYVVEGSRINFIAHFGDAFGFMTGITPIDDVIEIVDEDFARRDAAREDLFFMLSPNETGVEILYKDFTTFRLQFVFFEGLLLATTIQNSVVWNF